MIKFNNGVLYNGEKRVYTDNENRQCTIHKVNNNYFALYGYGMGCYNVKLSEAI